MITIQFVARFDCILRREEEEKERKNLMEEKT